MLLSENVLRCAVPRRRPHMAKWTMAREMHRSSEATSDGQMDHGQVRKPRISRQKPVTWPDTAFGHLTGLPSLGGVGQTLPRPGAFGGRTGSDLFSRRIQEFRPLFGQNARGLFGSLLIARPGNVTMDLPSILEPRRSLAA